MNTHTKNFDVCDYLYEDRYYNVVGVVSKFMSNLGKAH